MTSFACVVVTHFPDSAAVDHLATLAAAADLLVVVDNTPGSITPALQPGPKTVLIHNRHNIGLAAALNKGLRTAGQRGFENIFLFDQDSQVEPSFFLRMLAFKRVIDSRTDRCSLYVPNVYDRNSGTYARFPVIRKYRFHHHTGANSPPILLDRGIIAITSGSLLPYSRYQSLGPMPEDYFIDFIDNEYCLRMARQNYLVAVNFGILLDHAIGRRTAKKMFGLTLKPNNHPPLRRYFIARNGIATARRYLLPFPSFAVLVGLRLLHEAATILLFEREKKPKLKALRLGCADGLAGRMEGR